MKGKSSTMLYEQFGELKYRYRNREFWCRGYYVDMAGRHWLTGYRACDILQFSYSKTDERERVRDGLEGAAVCGSRG